MGSSEWWQWLAAVALFQPGRSEPRQETVLVRQIQRRRAPEGQERVLQVVQVQIHEPVGVFLRRHDPRPGRLHRAGNLGWRRGERRPREAVVLSADVVVYVGLRRPEAVGPRVLGGLEGIHGLPHGDLLRRPRLLPVVLLVVQAAENPVIQLQETQSKISP